jgi:myosin heavy subunit
MLERQTQMYKEMYERNLAHKDSEINDLKKELEREAKIKVEIKKDLLQKHSELDSHIQNTKHIEKKLKEANTKSENLKLMLVQAKSHFEEILDLLQKLTKHISEIKRSHAELLEAVRERDQRNQIDQACRDVQAVSMSMSNRDSITHSIVSSKGNYSLPPNSTCGLADFNDGSIRINSKDHNNPEGLFYDYMTNEQKRHIDLCSALMEQIHENIESIEGEVKKINILDTYKPVKQTQIIDYENMPLNNGGQSHEEEKYQHALLEMIAKEFEEIKHSLENLMNDIRAGNFEELKRKVELHDQKKGRYSDAEILNFKAEQDLIEDKENSFVNFTQSKPAKRLKYMQIN